MTRRQHILVFCLRLAHLSMIDWHSFLQVNLLPLRSLRGPPANPDLSPAMIPVLQSGSSFTKERIDKVAPEEKDKSKKLIVYGFNVDKKKDSN